jgi:N-acetylmuramoyl-L-alanine amidase
VVRIAIEVSGNFHFLSDRLHNPERLYFDLADTRPQLGDKPYWSETLADGYVVERVRLAQTTLTTTRVVLDLRGVADVSTVQLSNPNRLVIELRPAGSGAASFSAVAALRGPPNTIADPLRVRPAPIAIPTPPTPPAIHLETAPAPLALEWVPRPPPFERALASSSSLPSPETAKAARRTVDGDTSLVRTLGLKISRVAIDPGHGGHDQGTHGPNGLLEKDVVLDISLRLGKLIEDKLGAQVIYTRTDDSYVPLEARTTLANEKKADLFLSIHGNSSPVPRIVGTETYYLNFSDSHDALDVAARENASSQKSISELHDLIQKISLHDKLEESREFATRIQNALFQLTARNFPAEHSRGIKRAPFVVLIGADMPSVLAEIGFLTSVREEALLRRPDYRQKVAEALFQGVSRYADGLSHFQVATRSQ